MAGPSLKPPLLAIVLMQLAAAVAVAPPPAAGGDLQCTKGGMAGGDLEVGNYTITEATAWCANNTKCKAFTAKVPVATACDSKAPLLMHFKDGERTLSDPPLTMPASCRQHTFPPPLTLLRPCRLGRGPYERRSKVLQLDQACRPEHWRRVHLQRGGQVCAGSWTRVLHLSDLLWVVQRAAVLM